MFEIIKKKIEKLPVKITTAEFCVDKNEVLKIINEAEDEQDIVSVIIKNEMLQANNIEELQAIRKKYESKLYGIFVPIFDNMAPKD